MGDSPVTVGSRIGDRGRAAVLDWAWAHTDVDHIISLINADDSRSMRVATKIGERFERADVDPLNGNAIHVYGICRPR